jgi:hypothetical protein
MSVAQVSNANQNQFRGWVRPGQVTSERPIREEPGPKAPDHRQRIETALAGHPRKMNYGMFTQGLSMMGVRPTPANLTRVADLADSDPKQFTELARRARGNFITAADKERGKRKRDGKAAKAAKQQKP